jgi:hypothetical protein
MGGRVMALGFRAQKVATLYPHQTSVDSGIKFSEAKCAKTLNTEHHEVIYI